MNETLPTAADWPLRLFKLSLLKQEKFRALCDLLGPTDSRKAAKGTIRGDFGTEMMKNVVHASDSDENAKAELARFFRPEELYAL